MKINLKQKLMQLSLVELYFATLTPTKDREGKSVAILQLAEPIPFVRGSQEIEYNGRNRPLTAANVTEVKVHEDDMNDGFVFDDEPGSTAGSYKGSDLILDVAQNSTVWLRRTTFASGATGFRQNRRNERLSKIFNEAPKSPDEIKKIKETDAATPVVKPVETADKAKK